MQNIESLLQQLDRDCNSIDARNAAADLILHHLQAIKDSLGYWEAMHFANAIATLAMNAKPMHQPSTAWLRLCLVNLEKVLTPTNRRDEGYLLHDKQLDFLTYKQLIEAIESLPKKA